MEMEVKDMLYAIYACEAIYQGLHGMNSVAIVDCENEGEARDIAIDMSYEVMDSYNCIHSSFEQDASFEYDEGTDGWYQFIEDLRSENVFYYIHEIIDTKGKTQKELENELWENYDSFIEKYCKK